MPPLITGLHAITQFTDAFSALLLALTSGLLVFFALPLPAKADWSEGERFSVGLSAWLTIWLGLAGAGFALGQWIGIDARFWLWGGMLISAGFAIHRIIRIKIALSSSTWVLIGLFVISLLARLAYIDKLLVPPYVDSATHFRIIEQLIRSSGNISAQMAVEGGYYHLGVHLVSAGLARLLESNPGDILLVLGAFLLAALPFPLYTLLKRKTERVPAALWTVLLAGWGWPMPGHAVEWGKYPMLAGMLTGQAALAFAALAWHRRSWKLAAISLGFTLAATLFHSRMLIFIPLVITAWALAQGWEKMPSLVRELGLLALAILLTVVAWRIYDSPLNTLFRSYISTPYIFITLLVVVLLPFASRYYPTPSFASLLTALLLMASISTSVTVPTRGTLTLLDRPFVETTLYLPLALLGGLGYAGLVRALAKWPKTDTIVQSILWGSVFWMAAIYHPFTPTPCCNFFSADDATTMQWIDDNLPADASFLAAGLPLVVIENPDPAQNYLDGMDSAIWITPLTRRPAAFFPAGSDFASPDVLQQICQQPARFIYVGNMPGGFSADLLYDNPHWYQPELTLPAAKIYRVIGCP